MVQVLKSRPSYLPGRDQPLARHRCHPVPQPLRSPAAAAQTPSLRPKPACTNASKTAARSCVKRERRHRTQQQEFSKLGRHNKRQGGASEVIVQWYTCSDIKPEKNRSEISICLELDVWKNDRLPRYACNHLDTRQALIPVQVSEYVLSPV